MNKEIQQEAERILHETLEKAKPGDNVNHTITNAMISFAQQKQDERMIEFAEWVIEKCHKNNINASDKFYWHGGKIYTSQELLTIFNTEKGY